MSAPTIAQLRDWVVAAINDMGLGHTATATWRGVRDLKTLETLAIEVIPTDIQGEPDDDTSVVLVRSVLVLVRHKVADPDSIAAGDAVAQLAETIGRNLLNTVPDPAAIEAAPIGMELGPPIDPEVLNEFSLLEAAVTVSYEIHGA